MSLKKKLNQYGVLIVGLMIGGGFAFGGIASYAGLVDSGGSNGNNQNEFNATLPTDYYKEGSFGLTSREQRVLAFRNDIVFVNAFYQTAEQKQALSNLNGVQERFQGRMYINVVNYSDTTLFQRYGFNEFPKAVVVGGSRGNGVAIVDNVSNQTVSQRACQVMRDWKNLAAYCQSIQVN